MTAHFLSLFSAAAAGALMSAIWEGAVLVACIAFCLRFTKGINAGVRSILWTAALFIVVLLHFAPLLSHRIAGTSAAERSFHVNPLWGLAIVALWGALSLFRLTQLLYSAVDLRRIARRATPVTPANPPVLLAGWRSAQLCTSADVDRPSVIGFFRPRVLIPQGLFEKLQPAELEQIVLHEMEHLRRADDWTNLLQKISLMLFPINPVLLWVERRLCVERELACDDHVLRMTRAKKTYATCLVNLAEHSVLRRGATLALGAWERQSELTRRVTRILMPDEGVMGRWRMRLIAGGLTAGLLAGAVTLAREPQLITFSPAPNGLIASEQQTVMSPHVQYASAAFHEQAASQLSAPRIVDTVFREPARPDPARPDNDERVKNSPLKHHRAIASATSPVEATRSQFTVRRVMVRHKPAPAGGWMMLTDWNDAPQLPVMKPPQVRLLVSTTDQRTYAAIQTMNGWLVIQL